MSTIPVYNQDGKENGTMELPAIFALPFKKDLVHQTIVIQQGNRRQVSAVTKGRGEVSGGGKKPWKQKGTGRARAGSTRSPMWKGGGVSHGPVRERNYRKDLNEKMRKGALASVLSEKIRKQECIVVEGLSLEKPSSKKLALMVKMLPAKTKNILLLLATQDKSVILAARNITGLKTMQSKDMSALDALNAGTIVFSKESIKILQNVLEK